MVHKSLFISIAVFAVLFVGALFGYARAQGMFPGPDRVRFRMISNEPIATSDGGAVVAGSSAIVVQDRRTGQCYVAVSVGSAMAMERIDCGA